jgi:NitT/TauT family transport system substrate-binding protein
MGALAIAWTLFGLVPCGGAQAADLQTVQVAYIPAQLIDPPLFAGIARGYYKDVGIDLKMVKFSTGPAMTSALSGGSVQIAIAGAGLILNYAAQGNGVVIAPSYIDFNQIYATKKSGITSIAQLKGQRIGFAPGTTGNILVLWAAEKAGFPYSSIENVRLGYTETAAALVANTIPAAIIAPPQTGLMLSKAPDAVLVTDSTRFYPEKAVLGGVVVTPKIFDNDKAMLAKFLKAYVKSYMAVYHGSDREKLWHEVWELGYQAIESFDAFKDGMNTMKDQFPTDKEWPELIKEGKPAKWTEDVANSLIKPIGTIKSIEPTSKFIRLEMYLDAIKAQ